jgi:hypothetical protein
MTKMWRQPWLSGGCAVGLAAFVLSGLACARPPVRSDPVTAGMAKRSLVQGKTTQVDVLQAFGAPNIVSKNAKGGETWTYERVSYDSSYVQGGLGAIGGGLIGSGLLGGGASAGGGSSSSGSRTVTLIIHFDSNEVVSDYRVMETQF